MPVRSYVRTRLVRIGAAVGVAVAVATPTLFARQAAGSEICPQLNPPISDIFNSSATSPPVNWRAGDTITFSVSGPPGATLTLELPTGTTVATSASPLVYTVPADLLNTTATFRSNSATDVTGTIGCVSAAVPSVPFTLLITLAGVILLTAVVALARRREALMRA